MEGFVQVRLTAAEWGRSTPESVGLAGSNFIALQLIAFCARVCCPTSELGASCHDVAILRRLKVAAHRN